MTGPRQSPRRRACTVCETSAVCWLVPHRGRRRNGKPGKIAYLPLCPTCASTLIDRYDLRNDPMGYVEDWHAESLARVP